jgi:cytochrome c-type biogenesis protein CcmH/NrfG
MRAAYKERRYEWVVRCGIAANGITRDSEDVQRLLAQAAMRTRDYAIAADAWTQLMQLAPAARPSAALQLARCRLRLGEIEEGRTVLADLLRDEPDNAEAKALALEFDAATHA